MTMHTRVTYHANRSDFRIGDCLPLQAKEGARVVRGAVSVVASLTPCSLGLTLPAQDALTVMARLM